MKRSIAMLLALVLLTAMFPAATAAAPERPVVMNRVDPNIQIDMAKLQDIDLHYDLGEMSSYLAPDFDMYGMTVLKGKTMEIRYSCHVRRYEEKVIIMVCKGHYEDLSEDTEVVASAVQSDASSSEYLEWDTSGMSAGDYTILFAVVDANGDPVYVTMADVFISNKEIPMEKIGFYVHELGMETDLVRLPLADYSPETLTVSAVRYPYHTTDRRPIKIEGVYGAFLYGSGNFEDSHGYRPSGFVGRQYLCAYIYDGGRRFLTYLNVDVEELDDSHVLLQPDEGIVQQYICKGQENAIPIQIPAGESLENALIQTSRPGILAYRIEGDTLYVTPLVDYCGGQKLVVAFGNTFDVIGFHIEDHFYWDETIKEATCTEDGMKARVCRYCGDMKNEVQIPAMGHDVAEPVVLSEPTATKDGIGDGHCSRCDQDVEVPVSRIFTDTQPDWFYSDPLDYCYENGIINGLNATSFGPGATLNRAQLVTMLYRHAGSPEIEGENIFNDVPEGQFYTAPVIWASVNGIVNGYEDGSFRPAAPITREQIVTMLHRYVVSLDKDNGERNDLSAFTDLDMLHEYAREPMEWAVSNGVINGISETELGPQQNANRAQTVTILYRIITGILAE